MTVKQIIIYNIYKMLRKELERRKYRVRSLIITSVEKGWFSDYPDNQYRYRAIAVTDKGTLVITGVYFRALRDEYDVPVAPPEISLYIEGRV